MVKHLTLDQAATRLGITTEQTLEYAKKFYGGDHTTLMGVSPFFVEHYKRLIHPKKRRGRKPKEQTK